MLPSRSRAALVLVATLLTGCASASAGAGDERSSSPSAGAAAGDFGRHGPGPEDRPDPALSGQPVPTVPPGDPDGAAAEQPHEDEGHESDEHGAQRPVPASALLDAETVAAVVGGAWSAGTVADGDCLAAVMRGAAAERLGTLTSADGRVAQAVGRYRDDVSARAVVDATAARVAGCGFAPDGDPRLGERSLELSSSGATYARVVVVAAEGAVTVLAAGGSAAGPDAWPALADLSVGTLCAAGIHGCH